MGADRDVVVADAVVQSEGAFDGAVDVECGVEGRVRKAGAIYVDFVGAVATFDEESSVGEIGAEMYMFAIPVPAGLG